MVPFDFTQISIVIVNWNGKKFLRGLLESIQEQTVKPKEILMVDNGSEINSLSGIFKEFSWLKVIENRRNLGFSVGCNQGIRNTTGEWVLILNSDVYLSHNFLEQAFGDFPFGKKIGAVAPKLLRFDGVTLDTCGQFLGRNRRAQEVGYGEKDRGQFEEPQEVFSICGAAGFYRRTMLEDVAVNGEYFDESFFAFYEDLDLGWRAQNRGWKAYYTPRAVGYHYRGGSNDSNKGKHRIFNQFEFVRRPRSIQAHIVLNRYLMMIKNDSIKGFLKDFLPILKVDFTLWTYILLFRTLLIWDLIKISGNIRKAFQKRKWIQDRNRF